MQVEYNDPAAIDTPHCDRARCSDIRPCPRCCKQGLASTCGPTPAASSIPSFQATFQASSAALPTHKINNIQWRSSLTYSEKNWSLHTCCTSPPNAERAACVSSKMRARPARKRAQFFALRVGRGGTRPRSIESARALYQAHRPGQPTRAQAREGFVGMRAAVRSPPLAIGARCGGSRLRTHGNIRPSRAGCPLVSSVWRARANRARRTTRCEHCALCTPARVSRATAPPPRARG